MFHNMFIWIALRWQQDNMQLDIYETSKSLPTFNM